MIKTQDTTLDFQLNKTLLHFCLAEGEAAILPSTAYTVSDNILDITELNIRL